MNVDEAHGEGLAGGGGYRCEVERRRRLRGEERMREPTDQKHMATEVGHEEDPCGAVKVVRRRRAT